MPKLWTPRIGLVCMGLACFMPARAWAQVELSGPAPAANIVTRAPTILLQVEPSYPAEARAAHLTGEVALQIDIGADGHVTEVRVSRSAGHGFDEAALAAARQFVFTPAEIDGQPAAVQIEFVQRFAAVDPATNAARPALLPVSLRGRLLERGSRLPIDGAAVRVTVGDVQLEPERTGVDGTFAVRAPPGHAAVSVLDVGHRPYDTQEELKPGEQVEVTYYLMPKSFGNFESVIRGQRDKKEVTRHTLQREELQAVPGSFGDALRVLLNLPGLARTPFSSGGLIVRGALAFDTGAYFEGVQLPLLFHFAAGPSVVNSEFIDRIDFYPGGFGARYGRAIGATVDVEARAERPDRPHGSVKIDLIDTGVYLSAPLAETVTLSLAARRSYLDLILGPVLRATGSDLTLSPVYYDYQARLDWRPKALPRHKFKLFAMGSDDVLSVNSAVKTGTSFQLYDHQSFLRVMGQWSYRQDALSMKTMAFAGIDRLELGIGLSQIASPATVVGLRQDTELVLHPGLILRAGLDWQLRRQGVRFNVAAPFDYDPFPGAMSSGTPQTITTQIDQYDFGQWLEFEGKTPFGLRIMPSLRIDAYHAYGLSQMATQPRLVLRQEFTAWPDRPTAVKGAIGLYSELPSGQFSNPLVGNPSLAAQRALQMSLGVEQRLTPSLGIDLTGFWHRRRNLAVATNQVTPQADGTVKPVNYLGTGRGEAYGLEVLLRQELTQKFFGWIAYTLSWSEQRDRQGEPWHYLPLDERHILTMLGQYRFGNGWQVGGRFRVVTATPMTPVVSATYAADQQQYAAVDGPTGSRRGPTFHQLDLRVDRIWLFNTWQLGAYLDVQNIYNRQNVNFLQYDYRDQGSRVVPDLPILPTLGVKGVF